jgi:uncharacterized protein
MFSIIFASMIKRQAYAQVLQLMQQSPAVAILGPRQVGKTTLARQVAEKFKPKPIYLDLETPADLVKLNDPEAFFAAQADRMVILDEIQRAPEIFAVLRGIIDRRRQSGKKSGQFLILGSASLELLKQSSESLAGRISYVNLSGLDLMEVRDTRKSSLETLWLRGGFPDSYLAKNDAQSASWRQDFIRTYLERDVPQFGVRIPATTLRNFWTMLAHIQGGNINMSALATSMGVAVPTIDRYLALLEDLFLIRKLQPWFGNIKKRLVKSSKVFIRDSGILHTLLNIENMNGLMGHPVIGKSWEGFAIENILSRCPRYTVPYYYRTAIGVEMDLFLELKHNKRVAIEIKRSSAPALSKNFHIASADLGATHKFLVYPGKDKFPMAGGVWAMPLIDMLQWLEQEITVP